MNSNLLEQIFDSLFMGDIKTAEKLVVEITDPELRAEMYRKLFDFWG